MKYRSFGEMRVSEVGMGCWAIGGSAFGNSYGPTKDDESIAAVRRAVQLGCNFFDTADVYGHGHSEEILGTALRDVREKIFIATKAGGSYMYNNPAFGNMNFSADYIEFALEQSLKRLQTSYIDVYQLHNPTLQTIKEGDVFKPLRRLQQAGKIRHVGVSVFTLDEGLAALDHVDSVQCAFNIVDPRNYEMMETAKRRRIAIIVREPLANGLLTGKYSKASAFDKSDIRANMPPNYLDAVTEIADEIKIKMLSRRSATLAQVALKYVLSFGSVSVVIPGARTAEQVEENMGASALPELTDEELSFLGA